MLRVSFPRWTPGLALVVTGSILLSLLLRQHSGDVPVMAQATAERQSALTIDVNTQTPATSAISPLIYGLEAGASVASFNIPLAGQSPTYVSSTIRQAHAQAIRFGGDLADDYDWETDLIYPPTGGRPEKAGVGGPHAAIDQFLAFSRAAHVEPIIAVNAEIDDPQKAARLVAYTQRQGYHVTYWEIGGQPAGGRLTNRWTHFGIPLPMRQNGATNSSTTTAGNQQTIDPDTYAALVVAYVRAMRVYATPQHPMRIIVDSWIINATDQSWVSDVDLIDTHYFPFANQSPNGNEIVRSVHTDETHLGIASWLRELRHGLDQYAGGEQVGLMVGSWGMDSDTPAQPNSYATFAQGLYAAQMIGSMIDAGVQAATMSPIFGPDQGALDYTGQQRSSYYALSLFATHFGSRRLPVQVSPAAQFDGLTAYAATGTPAGQAASPQDSKTITLAVINTTAMSQRVQLHLVGAVQTRWSPIVQVWSLRHDAPDDPDAAVPRYGTTGIHHSSMKVTWASGSSGVVFVGDSLTLLQISLR